MPDDRDLVISRDIAATAEQLYRCWTEPALIRQWFTPPPWTVSHAETDVRPGGSCLIVMRGPDGQEMPNPGVYLDVVPNHRIVTTDAYTSAWLPSAKPFMTLILTFDDLGGGQGPAMTRYTAVARHWTLADREAHLQMGFHDGWGVATDQLAVLAKTLAATP